MKTIQDVTQKMEAQIREKIEGIKETKEDDDLITVRFRRPNLINQTFIDALQNNIGDISDISVASDLVEPFGIMHVSLQFLLRIQQ